MYGKGGTNFGDAVVRQPEMLALQQGFEALGKLSLIQLPGTIAAKLTIKRTCQARQDDFHQLLVHRRLASIKYACAGARRWVLASESSPFHPPLTQLYARPVHQAKQAS